MLSYDIQSLASKAVHVDGRLEADDPVWEEGDPRPLEAVRVIGRLSSAGTGKYYFSGRIEGIVELACRRCLTEVTAEAADEIQIIYAEAGDDDADDDPDVYQIDSRGTMLDLRPAIREHWLLTAPAFVECREDCRGLCPTCGTDLNVNTCSCEPVSSDETWAALKNLGRDAT
jgi:uncharacterized protein